ncbi:MAG: cyclic nucleotide-binding domain-containing protein [Candidatus Gastranaerophilales bacterium]|nr:cyclic nucleotide-binding domain-containing protein [Candidatus Gastranaerophilales bacterium]
MWKNSRELTINEVARIPFFNDQSDEDLKILSEMLELYYYDEDKYIFKEGEVQDSLFFIMNGSVRVLKKTEDGNNQTLAQFEAPQVIGEMAFISPGTRSASIMSITAVTAIRFGCSSFEKIIKIRPELAINILRKAGSTVSTRLKKANKTYLKAIHETENHS